MVGRALSWQRTGMNNSVQDWAVGDRRVHSELSGVVVCTASKAVYNCFITKQTRFRGDFGDFPFARGIFFSWSSGPKQWRTCHHWYTPIHTPGTSVREIVTILSAWVD